MLKQLNEVGCLYCKNFNVLDAVHLKAVNCIIPDFADVGVCFLNKLIFI